MRGLAGHPADNDRDTGFKKALNDYPNIKVVPNADGVATGWDPATTTKLINDFIASGEYDDDPGHLDVRHGLAGRRRDQGGRTSRSCRSSAPTSARSSSSCSTRRSYPGLKGVAVTNTGGRRRRGRRAGAQAPQRRDRRRRTRSPSQPNTVLLEAGRRRQPDRRGQGHAQVVARRRPRPAVAARPPDRRLDRLHPEQAIACKGPGE